jgi:hypothetical protein
VCTKPKRDAKDNKIADIPQEEGFVLGIMNMLRGTADATSATTGTRRKYLGNRTIIRVESITSSTELKTRIPITELVKSLLANQLVTQ